VHHQLWEWAKVGFSDKVDPAAHVYPHHKDGLFDPLATPKTPIREEVSDDEVIGAEAVVDDVVGPAYIVILSDQSNVLRHGAYWDVKTPFRTLP